MTKEEAVRYLGAAKLMLMGPDNQPISDLYYALCMAIEALNAQQWIPVTERLPKPVAPSQRREWFITSNKYGGVTVNSYEFEASPFEEGWQTNMPILAWMPLPEPYKGEMR